MNAVTTPVFENTYFTFFSDFKQEGQHPLTEQRAANFTLLANQ